LAEENPFLDPTPEEVDPEGLNDRIRTQNRFSTHPQSWFEWLFDHFDLQDQSQVLEVGCGPGHLWQHNQSRLNTRWEIYLSDISVDMVRSVHSGLSNLRLDLQSRIHYCAIDAQDIPFPDGRFDAVIAIGMLDHVPNRVRVFAEIRRLLRPGGRFYTATCARSHLQEVIELIRPFLPDPARGTSARFDLDNGAGMLSPWFADIMRYDYPDQYEFTQLEPALDYVLSGTEVQKIMTGEKRAALRKLLEEEIGRRGSLTVRSDKGLFVAGLPSLSKK
jgi:ubiquinone/menaquinone biosynthesis C-methylase UbiE